ncbi:hypothetical protein CW357_11265 [Rummeliibacillus sp. TYF005]|nr:hypothetical protein CW357_11265 [Rummeliibacillus sp. TYF005]
MSYSSRTQEFLSCL